MRPPFLSYVTWNRMGLTARNLSRLLELQEDFELHIIDSCSRDDTWNYVSELRDERIKSRLRLDGNRGPVYAFNLNLSKRKENQYYISMDNDVYMHTPDWISRFMEVFDTFSDVGLLGIPRSRPYPEYLPAVQPAVRDGVCCLKLKNARVAEPLDFIPGCCVMFRPEIFNYIGYWSEECPFTDAEISARITHYTPYRCGFVPNVKIDQLQSISCAECRGRPWCSLKDESRNCFAIWAEAYGNPEFVRKNYWKNLQFFEELEQGKRNAYCPSLHDPSSFKRIGDDIYYYDWVQENIKFYADREYRKETYYCDTAVCELCRLEQDGADGS